MLILQMGKLSSELPWSLPKITQLLRCRQDSITDRFSSMAEVLFEFRTCAFVRMCSGGWVALTSVVVPSILTYAYHILDKYLLKKKDVFITVKASVSIPTFVENRKSPTQAHPSLLTADLAAAERAH